VEVITNKARLQDAIAALKVQIPEVDIQIDELLSVPGSGKGTDRVSHIIPVVGLISYRQRYRAAGNAGRACATSYDH
jgi:hypothetical protein